MRVERGTIYSGIRLGYPVTISYLKKDKDKILIPVAYDSSDGEFAVFLQNYGHEESESGIRDWEEWEDLRFIDIPDDDSFVDWFSASELEEYVSGEVVMF